MVLALCHVDATAVRCNCKRRMRPPDVSLQSRVDDACLGLLAADKDNSASSVVVDPVVRLRFLKAIMLKFVI
jgi:hypothetical protein